MGAHDGGRAGRGNRLLQSSFDDMRLSRSRNGEDQFGHSKESWNSECDGATGNFGQTGKPTFAKLLPAANVVQGNNSDVKRIIKIRLCRIVECEVAVFADAEQAEFGRVR